MTKKVKVRDLSKELGISNDDILEQLHKLYVDAEDENSVVDDKIAGLIRIKMGGAVKIKEKKKAKTKKLAKAKPKKAVEKKEKETKEKKKITKTPAGEKTKKAVDEEKKKKPKKTEIRGIEIVKKAPKEEEPEKTEIADEEVVKTEKGAAVKERGRVYRSKPTIEIVKRGTEIEEELKKAKKTKKGKDKKSEKEEQPKKRKIAKGAKRSKSVIEIVENISRPQKRGGKKATKWGKAKEVGKKSGGSTSAVERKVPQKVQVEVPVSIRVLAPMINKKPNDLIQYLMSHDVFATINQALEEDLVREMLAHFGCELELPDTIESMENELKAEVQQTEKATSRMRAPIVTFMGHVDHGKTSLLDYIRNTMVAAKEKGGITQHIGAYKVETAKGAVAFLDTPGHAAFTAMRARGANVTDVVVLVVAADDGVMPQTKEAIDHARAADVPIVVAINKCDLAGASPDRVKRELQQEGLAPEDWGGSTVMVEVSAKTGEGVDALVEMLMLESELLELKANPDLKARGVVVEAKKTPGQGV